ncbi:MAG TPA: RNA-binding S4 domain-containing protein [Planktothrix sp.]|jgi:ribosome-associated protein
MSDDQTIQLDQFLKLNGLVQSGGEAKHIIQSGEVKVNGELETRRKRKLHNGDQVQVTGREKLTVKIGPPAG